MGSSRSIGVKFYGYTLILLSAIGFASFGVFAVLVGDTYEVFTQAWTRALIVSVVLLIVGLITKQLKPFKRKDLKWVAIFTAFSLFTVAPIYYSFLNMDIGTATILFYAAYMVMSYAVGRIFFKERITIIKIAAIILAIIGMTLIFGVELAGVSAFAMVLALLNGVASGGEVSFTKKVSMTYSPLQLTLVSWIAICVSHFIIAVILGENLFPEQTLKSSLGIVLYALAAMTAFWLVVAGYKRVEASIGGLIGTLEVPFAVLLGLIFFAQRPSALTAFGGALIFIAAALPDGLTLWKNRKKVKS
jgi:drug/metabolite transporter (DMT)-like permease